MIERCQSRSIAHVARTKWASPDNALPSGSIDIVSTVDLVITGTDPAHTQKHHPDRHSSRDRDRDRIHATGPEVVGLADHVRTAHTTASPLLARSVTKILRNLGLHRRRFIDPNGRNQPKNRRVIVAKRPGQMVHVDIKKVGKIPDGGGSSVPHGRGSEQTKAIAAPGKRGTNRPASATPICIPRSTAIRAWRTPEARDKRNRSATAVDFMNNARVFFAAHGINRIERVITATTDHAIGQTDFTASLREARQLPHQAVHTENTTGKWKRYNRILSPKSCLYSREYTSEEQRRTAVEVWNVHYNYHRDPHSQHAEDDAPAAYRQHRVTNVRASYN